MKRPIVCLAGALTLSAATAASALPLDLKTSMNAERECLALAIYWEARSGSEMDQLAVAHVTVNRVQDPKFPESVCDVVTQSSDSRKTCQYSWWCDGRSDVPEEPEAWENALALAEQVLDGETTDPTKGALFFHNKRVRPKWATVFKKTASIGAHLFYR